MLDRTPQVFISYSWTSDEYQERIINIASRLRHDGVDVHLDVWDLKDGHDKYAFMEQCVNNPDIDKVLIFSDKLYAEKADGRKGGVGNETTIITSKVYSDAKQEKFIPIVMERDENNNPYLPAYLQNLMYRDLSGDNFEKEYELLLRTIYRQPLYRKPKLGKTPEWLKEDEASDLFPIREAVKNVSYGIEGIKNAPANDFVDLYIESIKKFYIEDAYKNHDLFLKMFRETKEYRNVFLDNLKIFSNRSDFGEFIGNVFEKMNNTLYNISTFNTNNYSANYDDFELLRIHIWELFLCTATYMVHNELYKDLNSLLARTYFLRTSPLGHEINSFGYERFRFHSNVIEDYIKPSLENELSQKYTLLGHYMITEREYNPIYSKENIVNTDLLLYQVYHAIGLGDLEDYEWFPILYIYADGYPSIWKKLSSVQFCKKIMPLFGVDKIDDLKKKISMCVPIKEVRYSGVFAFPAPAILDVISVDNIGILP